MRMSRRSAIGEGCLRGGLCNLGQTLEDCEQLSKPRNITGIGWIGVLERLRALNFIVNNSIQDIQKAMQCRLREITGCLTEGLMWMHAQKNIQNGDLKPGNVLLRPGRVLITDFGISGDRKLAAETSTELHVGGSMGYMPPEVLNGLKHNPANTDIYSLGCVFLRILSVI